MRKALPILLCFIALLAIGLAIFFRRMSRNFPNYTPDQLAAIADSSRSVREALDRFKSDQGHDPALITNLFPSYLQPTNAPNLVNQKDWAGWEYSIEPLNSYRLFYQLDWDGGLSFEHVAGGSNRWLRISSGGTIALPKDFQQ